MTHRTSAEAAVPDRVSDIVIALGLALLSFVMVSYIMGSLVLLAGGILSPLSSAIALGSAFAIALAIAGAHRTISVLRLGILTVILLSISGLASAAIIDTSIDGQNYHFQAIAALQSGWNPVYEEFQTSTAMSPLSLPPWPINYPKASWIFTALLQSVGIPIEAAKCLGPVMLLAAGLLATGALLRLGVCRPIAVVSGLLATANPVAISQMWTRMNDGVFGSCYVAFIALFVIAATRGWDRRSLIVMVGLTVFAVNLKFSIIPIWALLCGAACLAAFWLSGWAAARRLIVALMLGGIAGIFIFGFQPYVTNTIEHGHPFYPLFGEGAADIMTSNSPDTIQERSASGAFVFSLFAETHSGFGGVPSVKVPFTISQEELRMAGGVDTRIGGFGPLFSGALLIAVASLTALLVRGSGTERVKLAVFAIAVTTLTVAVMPENWWARYVPQLWLVPILIAVAATSASSRLLRYAAFAILGILVLNSTLIFASSSLLAMKRSEAVRSQIAQLKEIEEPIFVQFGYAKARLALFQDAGLNATAVSDDVAPPCKDSLSITAYGPDREGGSICVNLHPD
ncbi:hypothetical protein [Croceicoccus hydrothermalis]|uniref:hypothetical protein n=1 Tax=Croceicoccus hydrothermalis TaxID=2867964 RepID=UPI001EFB69CF|nr:hypothetical protein [Croceicoccus hydrothermalis]